MESNPAHGNEDLWVFAYGSLMWRPGFASVERAEARLVGAHRALCVYSFVHRGTAERPGLVLGLDRGGTCRGIAYRVSVTDRADVVFYLRKREQVTSVYREAIRPIWLRTRPERRVPALCYMVDRGHPQYAGRLSLDQQLHHVRQGHGISGTNRDYVTSTVAALEQLGYRETELHLLAQMLGGQRSEVRDQIDRCQMTDGGGRRADVKDQTAWGDEFYFLISDVRPLTSGIPHLTSDPRAPLL